MSLNLEEVSWGIAKGATDEYEFEIRYREFSIPPDIDKYPQRLNIFWSMNETFENGFASENELAKMHSFENRLVEAVESDEFSIMSMILTGNACREFVFHTPDPQEFVNRLTNMPQESDAYPIEISCNEDPEWVYYYDEIGSIKGF